MCQSLSYYAYISRSKVAQLHEQLLKFTVDKRSVKRTNAAQAKGEASGLLGLFKAGLSAGGSHEVEVEEVGTQTDIQKLAVVLDHIERHERVLDLGALCRQRQGVALDAFCYVYEGAFYCLGMIGRRGQDLYLNDGVRAKARNEVGISKELLIEPARRENAFHEKGPNDASLVSDMVVIGSEIESYGLRLACSYKYFSDMGGSWNEAAGEWDVHPHSGNYHFFSGVSEAYYRSIVFLTGVSGNTIMGTPLCLANAPNPALRI